MLVWNKGLEKIMARSARIGLAAVLLLGAATFVMAQNGRAGAHARTKYPNHYGHGYPSYYAQPRYAPYDSYFCRTPYYVLGYPVPHYGYRGWCDWR
jgi:hypothetical protein